MHRGRQHAALPRQIRHLLFLVILWPGLPTRNGARRTRRRVRKDVADLRARRRCNRGERGNYERRTTGYGKGSKHLARLRGSNQDRDIVQI
jgi:hypothetical protein